MILFYISYWGVKESLTVSTVYPHLKILAQREDVTAIHFFTVERAEDQKFKDELPPIPKTTHYPIFSKNMGLHLLTKAADWWRIQSTILAAAKAQKPDFLICRSSMASGIGHLVKEKLGIPYMVESFEPHTDYMVESGVWSPNGIKTQFQRKKEAQTKATADAIVGVSYNYQQQLIEKEGLAAEKVYTVPCTVPLEHFAFDENKRAETRAKLGLSEDTVIGLYLGKFGGSYYDKEAFQIFKAAANYYQDRFFLCLLSPASEAEVKAKLAEVNFPENQYFHDLVAHNEVPNYLSAADFAFSLIKPAPSRPFCSPIKNGEYWAAGLPILVPANVGDDSDIIQKEQKGGIIINLEVPQPNYQDYFEALAPLLAKREEAAELAQKYRSPDQVAEVYDQIIRKLSL